ncbi:sensor histidine kinase [Streptomyces sp. ICN441]|uniref:Sensor histidine kinase n=1 Tax=Streptomyces tirandamycinicus TaxID=2174846 RepID=A0A2S1SYF6_9ACTN|nr:MULTISPECIES: anti-sigma factor RsbA family regulatory protein [Streptomyces]AWI31460.1 sensor histidine kinase [Streptomyces tirandamycinicus]TFE48604.1 sensor histidine kinase [Streptomyces sp. ICN441]
MTTRTRQHSLPARDDARFRHPALFYTTEADYAKGVGRFVRGEAARAQPVLVAVPGERLTSLKDLVGEEHQNVTWVDMRHSGRNPGRILSMLQEFADRHADRSPVIVGEPIWVGRTAAEAWEATRHEALINLAFAGRRATILCPYDTALPEHVLRDAHRTHPVIGDPGGYRHSPHYTDPHAVSSDCDVPLPDPQAPVVLRFEQRNLGDIRDTVSGWGESAGLSAARHTDWLLAVNEATGNSVRHGGGSGTLRLWRTADTAVAEVSDRGRFTDPLIGRRRPDPLSAGGGRGVWMMHQLCDLVEIRSWPSGLVVRLHVALE